MLPQVVRNMWIDNGNHTASEAMEVAGIHPDVLAGLVEIRLEENMKAAQNQFVPSMSNGTGPNEMDFTAIEPDEVNQSVCATNETTQPYTSGYQSECYSPYGTSTPIHIQRPPTQSHTPIRASSLEPENLSFVDLMASCTNQDDDLPSFDFNGGSDGEFGAPGSGRPITGRSKLKYSVAQRPSLNRIVSVRDDQGRESYDACPPPQQQQQDSSFDTSMMTKEQREDMELEEMARQLYKPPRIPKGPYNCHICGQSGHFITDCPQKDDTGASTPYQGPKMCYGEFTCPRCKRNWASGRSMANTKQKCKKCQVEVFPRKQLQLEKAIERGLWKPNCTDDTVSICNSSIVSGTGSRCPSRLE